MCVFKTMRDIPFVKLSQEHKDILINEFSNHIIFSGCSVSRDYMRENLPKDPIVAYVSDDNEVVGMFCVDDSGYLFNLYVLPKYRKKGYATVMLHKAVTEYHATWLKCESDHLLWYLRRGWYITDRQPGECFDGRISLHWTLSCV